MTSTDTRIEDIETFLRKLEDAPSWPSLQSKDGEVDDEQIRALGERFKMYSTDDARRIVERFTDRALKRSGLGEPVNALSKLYILNRFYFRVPYEEEENRARFFGGWLGLPVEGSKVNLLWPIADTEGSLRVVGQFVGYLGDVYDPIGEFDYFNAQYGRRGQRKQ